MVKGYWEHIEGSRGVKTYACCEYRMLIIPSLQGDLYHVIMERENEGVTLNCLLTDDTIKEAHGIDVHL